MVLMPVLVAAHMGVGGTMPRINCSLITFNLAVETTSPPLLVALHEYFPECSGSVLRILMQQVPLICVITKSGDESMLTSSLNHEMAGDGMPVTWHSNICWVPAGTSDDLNWRTNSGGTIFWCVSIICEHGKNRSGLRLKFVQTFDTEVSGCFSFPLFGCSFARVLSRVFWEGFFNRKLAQTISVSGLVIWRIHR